MVTLERIENPRMMEVRLPDPGPRAGAPNRLYIFGGIAVFEWTHETDDRWEGWVHDSLHISMISIPGVPRIFDDQVSNSIHTVSLAQFSFSDTWRTGDTWGYSIDSVSAYFPHDHALDLADFGLNVELSLRGYKTNLFRLSFQLMVLARV